MNRKQRRGAKSREKAAAINISNKSLTLDQANALAVKEMLLGQFAAAVEIYDQILAKVADHPKLHANRGVALRAAGLYPEALASFDQALALKPDDPMVYNYRGSVLRDMRRYDDALSNFDRAVALKPDYGMAYNGLGVTLYYMRRYDEALASFDKAIALNPNDADACANRANTLASKGDMQEAEIMFRKALALKPDFAVAWYNLCKIRQYHDTDNEDVRNIQALLQKPGISRLDMEHVCFALGKIYDDCERFDEAFTYYRQANDLIKSYAPYDAAARSRMTDEIIEVFNKDLVAMPHASASDSRSPLFIVGMPRSGTTLMASVLSNHPAIAMAGELPLIANFTQNMPEVCSGVPYPQAALGLASEIVTRFSEEYEKRLRRDADADVPYIIDKQPLNFWHLGLIAILFPQARIVHCVRHALDTGLSNFFQRFAPDYSYSFDLRATGHFYNEYAKVMTHWQQVLPGKIIEVNYADLVLDTEKTARRVIEALGLEWDSHCLAPHTNRYAVETASHWQVRQPIYHKSLDRWRHYESHLAPLKESLRIA